ncbi:MAG: lasso peptide biosynthesis B2 protein [Anaerolineae bacterium]|nr:lasso peptide biosynthesis B2 protein [Anaerolineae bacterium]
MSWSKSLRRKLELARGLTLGDWLALLEAWLALLAFWILLRLVSAERLRIPSSAQAGVLPLTAEQLVLAEHLYRLVGWAARLHWPPKTCLPRSLTLRWMLAQREVASALRIGARKMDGQLKAHAWVELGSHPIGETANIAADFTVFSSAKPGTNLN